MGGGFKKTGDWDVVGILTKNLKKEIDRAVNISVRRFGLKAEAIAKEHISTQDLPWVPLNPAYKKAKMGIKGQHGRTRKDGKADRRYKQFSDLTLVRTSTYFQSITSWHEGYHSYAGVRRNVTNEEGQEIANIAKIHEYGSLSQNIPARPLWQPAFKEAVHWHVENNLPAKHLLENLKKKYKV